MANQTTIMSQHEKYIQDPKRCRGNSEEVSRYQIFGMVVQKGPPRLRGRFSMPEHILGNGRLGNFDAEHLQLTVNPWCTPANVISGHRLDKFTYLGINGWAPTPAATGPAIKNCVWVHSSQLFVSLAFREASLNPEDNSFFTLGRVFMPKKPGRKPSKSD